MSRTAYEAYFLQPAPADAYFGVDISWYQGASDNEPSRAVAEGYWDDFGNWASYVCVRTSYGQGGDDGAQGLHFQIANERGYPGSKGCYHYVIPSRSAVGNVGNFLTKSAPFVDQTKFDMLDFEEGPNPGASYINEACDRVTQVRQRPCYIYGGKSYLDGAGAISCAVDMLWVAHYASRRSNAWQPTTDWSSWGAPLMPDQYGAVSPGIWQWQSLTPEHGSLDLNMTTNPVGLGILDGPDPTPIPVPKERDDYMPMLYVVQKNTPPDYKPLHGDDTNYAIDGFKAYPISNPYTVAVLQAVGALMRTEDMISRGYTFEVDGRSIETSFEIQPITESIVDFGR